MRICVCVCVCEVYVRMCVCEVCMSPRVVPGDGPVRPLSLPSQDIYLRPQTLSEDEG